MNIIDIAIAKQLAGGGGGSGTDSYNDLSNLPKINDVTLSGNKSSSALGLQSEITSDSKLASDLVDDTNQDNKFVTSTEKNTWNGKQNAIDADHKINADYVDDSTSTNKFVTASDKETWNAKQNAIDADHKLSSSLVSFTTAEAAALASGIDSTKVAQISTNQSNILSVEDMVCATEFSSSTAYAVGDMVTYEHKLYKFINAHQGAWSASDVQNYDLTRLEAEDRASLAEVVDSGAKNVWDFANAIYGLENNITQTKTASDLTVSSSAVGGWSYVSYGVFLPVGNYVLSFKISNLTRPSGSNPMIRVATSQNGDSLRGQVDIASNGQYSFEFNIESAGTYYVIFGANWIGTPYEVSYKASDLMVATKAAFGVSQKFVPYRPNWDLVGSTTNALLATAYNTVTSANNYVTSIEGGYIRIGNLVVVNVKCTVNTNIPGSTPFIDGLPKPIINYNTGYGGASVVNNKNYSLQVIGTGSIAYAASSESIPSATTLVMNCTYFTK